jgi:hypothetical protein
MSGADVRQILNRTMTDEAFFVAYLSDPKSAIAGYDLTPQEQAALLSGDQARISRAATVPLPPWWPKRPPTSAPPPPA